MENKNTIGYTFEEKANSYIERSNQFYSHGHLHTEIMALTHVQLASVEIGRKIASTLVDIEIALRDLVKILSEKNQKAEEEK